MHILVIYLDGIPSKLKNAHSLLAGWSDTDCYAQSDWEGGIRVNALVSGGWLPARVHGSTVRGLMTGWDWYATWAALGGISDLYDPVAAAAGLRQPDSFNMWPMLSGTNGTSPRVEVVIGSNVGGDEIKSGATAVAALIRPPWKIILGEGPGDILDMACWTGPESPNSTTTKDFSNFTQRCGRTPQTGCLYDICTSHTCMMH
jgi:hypothetical protein